MSGPVKSNIKGWHFSRHLLFWGAFASSLWSIYFAVVTISIPYQIEFREGAAQVMTEFLLHGDNPFRLENQPLAMNNYGLGYNLVVVPFGALWEYAGRASLGHLCFYHFVLSRGIHGDSSDQARDSPCLRLCSVYPDRIDGAGWNRCLSLGNGNLPVYDSYPGSFSEGF